MEREQKILEFIKSDGYVPLKTEELAVVLDVPKSDYSEFLSILESLENKGDVVRTKRGRYTHISDLGYIKGIYRGNRHGFGFVVADNGGEDVFVASSVSNGALNGDTVLIRVTNKGDKDKKPEGEIVRVISRANETIVGRFDRERNFSFVIADDPRISNDIFIPKSKTLNAKNGHKVVVKITKWGDGTRNPEGEVVEILGFSSQPGVDVLSVMKRFGLTEEFPEAVSRQLKNISAYVPESEIAKRYDFRNDCVITIDGEDAKDLDDAVCVKETDSGFSLSVHIADVSHYVTENTPLDKEAFRRGTSVYFADRVVPMLPKALSNGICSLNPGENRLTLSVTMDIDFKGNVKSHKIEKGVIRTIERMTYEDVSLILEGDKTLSERYAHIKEEIFTMCKLSRILRKKRESRGSINFDFPESKIVLDKNGKPIDIYKYRITEAHSIIEEFMLVCNETVAQQFYWMEAPFVYRIHEKPSMEKLGAFNDFLKNMSLSIKADEDVHPMEFSNLLKEIDGTSLENLISRVMLRTLMKAKYSDKNQGHFGLAFNYYCHFTSPIRRYPDLVIHRIIKEYLLNPPDAEREEKLRRFVNSAAVHSSEAEINAEDAEREVEELKKAQYMIDKIGEKFNGVISSIASFGMFVELDNTVEGCVRVKDMNDDYYIYNEKHLTLTGEKTKKIYKIGDNVRIEVASVNTALHEIDFVLADN